jgi:hypothetical protein
LLITLQGNELSKLVRFSEPRAGHRLPHAVFDAILALVAVCFSVVAPASYAEELRTLIGYECDPGSDRLTLSYVGAYDEKGTDLVAHKSARQWDPRSLVELAGDGLLTSQRTVEASCALSDGLYAIELGPEPADASVQGPCGAFMGAWASVSRDGEVVLPHYPFDTCEGSFVIASVVIRPHSRPMVRTVAKSQHFY